VTKLIFCVNWIVYIVQRLYFLREDNKIFEAFASCLAPTIFAHQFYRVFTSVFTHGNLAHILLNTHGILVVGNWVENAYGSIFYAFINFWLLLASNLMELGFQLSMVYVVPISLVDLSFLLQCGVGYSGILYGLLMIQVCCSQEKYLTVLGFKICYFLYPIALIIATAVLVPNTSTSGHVCGVVASFLLMNCGLSIFIP
jgi:rhomboid protease GluP